MPFDNTKLLKLRIGARITQVKISNETGIDVTNYQRLENGKTKNPRFETVEVICKFFGKKMDYFSKGEIMLPYESGIVKKVNI